MPERSNEGSANAFAAASHSSVVQNFGIRGLYGYRDIELSSKYAATILIAKNGTGKTTLLGAMDSFLRRSFLRLMNLHFSEIYCTLRGYDEELVVRHADLEAIVDSIDSEEFVRLSRRVDQSPKDLLKFLTEEWPHLRGAQMEYYENKFTAPLMRSESFSMERVARILDGALQNLYSRSPVIARVFSILTQALDSYEIVYLPTYRRVELAVRGEPSPSWRARRRTKVDVGGSIVTDIQFGLSDISDRLDDLNRDIVAVSNAGYQAISASMINELIDGTFESEAVAETEFPSRPDLELFFARLEDGRHGPYLPVSRPNLDRLYAGAELPGESRKFLEYFLRKLQTVISSTKKTERSVQDFINMCNSYLTSEDLTTVVHGELSASGSGKVLILNRNDLSVHVEDQNGRQITDLDALSSGEKQMISLFAKLYLYEKPKIVLIDEPELSLSIDWQRSILVDIINSPMCAQCVAITHSPFVFDNELEPFARPVTVRITAGSVGG